jgi:cytochrome c biogenesis protein CcdA
MDETAIMEFGLLTYAISFAAGVLSTLSPCVLPLLPILIGSAVTAHRLGPVALAAGLTLSFAVIGTLIASAGASLGLEPSLFRNIAAIILAIFGLFLVSAKLQEWFTLRLSGLAAAGNGLSQRITLNGWQGQFALGMLLGIIWSPCVGPTLGAAITLAAQGRELAQVSLVMGLFGLGAGLTVMLLGLLSRRALAGTRGKLLKAGKYGKMSLGAVMLLLAFTILTGLDKQIETWLLDMSPDWLLFLTTSL